MKCRCCGTKDIAEFFSLGKMPLVNNFLTKQDISTEKKYRLAVSFCPTCYLVQLSNSINPAEIFSHYLYLSGASSSFIEHCKKISASLIERFKLNSSSVVMEIGSNDGTLLKFFKEKNIGIVGVDPAKNIAEIAIKSEIPTCIDFFSKKFASNYIKSNKNVDLIFGANVLAHVPKINDFLQGTKLVLKPNGTAIFEFPYIKGLFENKFDTIYHEHVFYYSLLALQNLFKKSDLDIYDYEFTETQGGSLRIYTCHSKAFTITNQVKKLEQQELKNGYNKLETYNHIKNNILKLKHDLKKEIKKILKSGKSIAAYSAPAKGNILLNYFKLGKSISFIVDKASTKQGLYTPGTHLLVESIESVYAKKPDYLLILCWNIANEIILQEHKYKQNGGQFIIPIPKIEIK